MHHSADGSFNGLLEELTARSLSEQVRTAQRYRELMAQVAAGELDAATLGAEHDRLLSEHQAQLARDVAALGVRYYESILDLNRAYVDRLFDALATAARPAHAAPAEGAPSRVQLRLRGQPGERVEARFAVANTHPDTADVVFYASEFTGDEGEVFRAPIELDPPRLRLASATEHAVALGLELSPEHFQPGHTYRAEVIARGGDEVELELVIEVEPA
jgi:hypothetical protein